MKGPAGTRPGTIMGKKKRPKPRRLTKPAGDSAVAGVEAVAQTARACDLSVKGEYAEARGLWQRLDETAQDPASRARARNGMAVLTALEGDLAAAEDGFRSALGLDS